jgi:hypothetical protein
MLSAVVAVMSLGIILLIVAGFILVAVRMYRRQYFTPAQATRAQIPTHPLDRHVTAVLYMQDGIVVDIEKPKSQPLFTVPQAWYKRYRIVLSLGFLLMLVITLCVQTNLGGGTLRNLGIHLLGSSQADDLQTASHSSLYDSYNASKRLVRISQLDPAQYNSSAEYNTWAYAACSTAAMTEVFNAYGYHLHITDVLKVEAQIGMITPSLGLVDPSGIARTATYFGFHTNWSTSWNINQLINTANSGKPVIVDFPPDRYAGGHLLVVTGGDANYVYLADSSSWNHQELTHAQFMQWWAGYAAVVTPR